MAIRNVVVMVLAVFAVLCGCDRVGPAPEEQAKHSGAGRLEPAPGLSTQPLPDPAPAPVAEPVPAPAPAVAAESPPEPAPAPAPAPAPDPGGCPPKPPYASNCGEK